MGGLCRILAGGMHFWMRHPHKAQRSRCPSCGRSGGWFSPNGTRGRATNLVAFMVGRRGGARPEWSLRRGACDQIDRMLPNWPRKSLTRNRNHPVEGCDQNGRTFPGTPGHRQIVIPHPQHPPHHPPSQRWQECTPGASGVRPRAAPGGPRRPSERYERERNRRRSSPRWGAAAATERTTGAARRRAAVSTVPVANESAFGVMTEHDQRPGGRSGEFHFVPCYK